MPILKCRRCSADYSVPLCRMEKSKYCSFSCTKINKRCERCNKPITKRPGRRRFCSHLCATSTMVGPKSPVWKGGNSRARSRDSVRHRRWSRSVFERDGFRCRNCGSGKSLHAHHIKPYATHPRDRFKISNGKTLCAKCHSAVHGHKPMAAGKKCVDCGKRCTNKNRQGKPRCQSCGLKRWNALGRPSHQENTERLRQMGLPFD